MAQRRKMTFPRWHTQVQTRWMFLSLLPSCLQTHCIGWSSSTILRTILRVLETDPSTVRRHTMRSPHSESRCSVYHEGTKAREVLPGFSARTKIHIHIFLCQPQCSFQSTIQSNDKLLFGPGNHAPPLLQVLQAQLPLCFSTATRKSSLPFCRW